MRVAWAQAVASLRQRRGRNLVTFSAIALAVAFFVHVRIGSAREGVNDRTTFLLVAAGLMATCGILNTMLLSISERFREIGTLKCLGASDGVVVAIVLIEAAILGSIASVVGALVGALLASGIGAHFVLEGVLVGLLLTIASSIPPAWVAAKMPASQALRAEQ